jgi:hypothetical protein
VIIFIDKFYVTQVIIITSFIDKIEVYHLAWRVFYSEFGCWNVTITSAIDEFFVDCGHFVDQK